ncbi:MAG: carboxypeptidase regulatory-like domain-containing protein [Planctomycetes bacterium]|nr:carboxypeptidase regulatory-like domain-containing protein [Planctomycetota bacterium]
MKALFWLILVTTCLTARSAAQDTGDAPPTAAATGFTGRVVDPTGAPIAGAAIAIAAADELDTDTLLAQPMATTDANGRFTLAAPTAASTGADDLLELGVAANGFAAIARAVHRDRTDVGVVVLTAGRTLLGRVRDTAGNALGDVRIVAADLLELRTMLPGPRHGFRARTRSRPGGIFRLPGALPAGVRLEFYLPGYQRTWLEPVAADTPLEVALVPTGWLQGRVLDTDGRGVADAAITVAYELRAAGPTFHSGADGSFRVPLERPCRWRLTAERRAGDTVVASARTAALAGPHDNLELVLQPNEDAEPRSLTLRVVAPAGGAPIADFAAAVLWEKVAAGNPNYREFRFRQRSTPTATGHDGIATLPGPSRAQQSGAIRVVAPGFAPATRLDVEWAEPSADAPPPEVTIELEPEATIRGTVRIEGSTTPIAGARVRARPLPDPSSPVYPDDGSSDGTATATDGSFELRGLGAGSWQLIVEHDDHPSTEPVLVELAAAEQQTDRILTLPRGATVRGRLAGVATAGTRVFLAPLPTRRYGEDRTPSFGRLPQNVDQRGVEVGDDGAFAFTGIPLGDHELVVRLPTEPRHGGDLFLAIEPFRVRADGIDREFDCSADVPARIRGRISFPAVPARLCDLVVVAETASTPVRGFRAAHNQRYAGPRAFVGRDGTFELRVGAGDYWLTVVDLATGVALHADSERLTVAAGGAAERDLELALARVDLTLTAAPGVDELAPIDRVEVRFVPQRFVNDARNQPGNDRYDSGAGLSWPPGQSTVSIVLPAGAVTFLCRNEVGRIRVDAQRWQNAPPGRAELEVVVGEGTLACAIEVEGPSEIVETVENAGDETAIDGAPRKGR